MKEANIKHLIRLIIVIVVGLIVIISLLILKPILMRRRAKEHPLTPRANPNMEVIIVGQPVRTIGGEKAVVMQKEFTLEIIKDRFLNKTEPEEVVVQLPSSGKIESEELKLTPTFGEYTFSNNK